MKSVNDQQPKGARLDTPGSSREYKTGAWGSGVKPVHIPDNCINCLFCYNFCPDQCWQVKDGKIEKVDLEYCKGCGVCANECPVPKKAIEMSAYAKASADKIQEDEKD